MSYKHPSGETFEGVIGKTIHESSPWWPSQHRAPNSPNIVVIVLDDTGFSHLGCYGSTIDTPVIDRLAANGLRYTNFHTTALCSSTRACLMTGRNHHAVGMRAVSNMDTGFPNMRGYLPRSSATLAEILRTKGFGTYAAGKWHLTPMAECTAAGPFHNWPLARGFDRFYGFMQGETDQFYPELTSDNHHIAPPASPEEGYHVSEDIVDRSIGFLRDQISLVPERPFFLYLAFGATHSPHQAPAPYLSKYRGRFDAGWDVTREEWFARQKAAGVIPQDTQLAPRNPGVRPWAELSENERLFAARLQEAFAAQLDHADTQIGRLVAFLEEVGRLDDTLLIVMSDNGASQEGGPSGVFDEMRWFNAMPEDVDTAVKRLDDVGGPESHSNIPWGWAQVGNTPLKWYKQNTHGGGVRDPLIAHWPNGLLRKNEFCRTFAHAIDITPTILDIVGADMPATFNGVEQMPLHGKSLRATFTSEPARHDRGPQYFEMLAHRGIWADGWKAVTRHISGRSWDDDVWELYHLDSDFSEANDLAASDPARLRALIDTWWSEAERNGVLPLDDRNMLEVFRASRRPGLPSSRDRFTYYPPISHIVADACPSAARGWVMTVDLDHPETGGCGALVNRGTINSGFVLYIKNDQVRFDYNAFHAHTTVVADAPLRPGKRQIVVRVEREGNKMGADVHILIDGEIAATGEIPRLLGMLSSSGMDIGHAMAPVCKDYAPPFAYGGKIRTVIFDLPPRVSEQDKAAEAEREARAATSRQ